MEVKLTTLQKENARLERMIQLQEERITLSESKCNRVSKRLRDTVEDLRKNVAKVQELQTTIATSQRSVINLDSVIKKWTPTVEAIIGEKKDMRTEQASSAKARSKCELSGAPPETLSALSERSSSPRNVLLPWKSMGSKFF